MATIRTDSETYLVDDATGQITRAACGWRFSGDWLCVGFERYTNFGHRAEFVPFESLRDGLNTLGEMTFKSGKPRWHVVDRDHGSLRVWGEGARAIHFA